MFDYWKKKFVKQTLHRKIYLSIMFFSVIPLFLVMFATFISVYKGQMRKVEEEIYKEVENVYGEMSDTMNTIELVARTIWADTSFLTEIGKAATDGNLREYDRYIFQEYTLSTIKVIASMGNVQSARIYLDYPGLREYFAYLYSMDRAEVNRWYPERDSLSYKGQWYLEVAENTSNEVYSTYLTEKNMASFVIPLKINSSLTGIFEILLPMETIVSGLYHKDEAQDIFLMDGAGFFYGVNESSIITGMTEADLLDIMKISSFEELEDGKIVICRTYYNHVPVMLAAIKNQKTGILLVKIASMREQYLYLLKEFLVIFVFEILLIVLLIKAINGIVKHLLHDFDIFTQSILEVEQGNLDVQIPELEQMEINAVAVEYNKMLGKIKQLMEINIRREVMVKEAQLKSLEKQIDSHFLYNVLDSIKMMAEVKQIYNVSDALLALSRMFRYNLQVSSHSVSFQEEISYLESYLKLCNIRYDYYIDLCENIEERLRKMKVPKVILQPIAENSIAYGLDDLSEDTTIYLKAYTKDELIYIEMTDMGKGMKAEYLEEVRQGIKEGGTTGREYAGGIGLHNIDQRIKLMYGESYGVEIYSKENCYTKVVLVMPTEGLV